MRRGRTGILISIIAWSSVGAQTPADETAAQFAPTSRLLHRFDFNERDDGNLEDIPKFWDPIRPADFPHYAVGVFDHAVGRTAAPSFRLHSEGRNVAFQYAGPETRIRVNTDYRIVGFVRANHLPKARACLSAHYLDEEGRAIAGTMVRSGYVGSSAVPEHWEKLEMRLGVAPLEAHSIALIAWVLQESQWNQKTRKAHAIPKVDVYGGAWFDDISIFALPRTQMTTSSPGDVLASDGPQELRITLADNTGFGVAGKVTVTSADGGIVAEQHVTVTRADTANPVRLSVAHLPPGIYDAKLDVFADGEHVVSRSLRFARLGDLYRGRILPARSFGIVLDPNQRADVATEIAMLEHHGVGTVKIPVWTGRDEEDVEHTSGRALGRMLQSLSRRGFAMYGVLHGPPTEVVQTGAGFVRPLVDLLADDPEGWRQSLAEVVAPFAGTFRSWQIGPDQMPPLADAKGLDKAIAQLKAEIRPYISVPKLTIPLHPSDYARTNPIDASEVSATIGHDTHLSQVGSQIQMFRDAGYETVSAYIEPLPSSTYMRMPRLADWIQRLLTARHAGASTVFVPQTWSVDHQSREQVTRPSDTMIVLRTITDLIGDASAGPVLDIADGVQCLAFYSGNEAVLALWDTQASDTNRSVAVQLGQAQLQIDAWGQRTLLKRDRRGRQIVNLGALPVFVPGVERWLTDFRNAFRVLPGRLSFGETRTQRTLEINYRGDRALFGDVRIDAPDGWDASPRHFSLAIAPRKTETQPLVLQFPHSESAGEKIMRASVQLTNTGYELDVRLPVSVRSSDLDVWALAVMEGENLFLRQVIKNLSNEILSFRASANVPGRERQYRPIANLQPGEIQTVEYRFRGGRELSGRSARLMLREVNDGPRTFNLEKAIP